MKPQLFLNSLLTATLALALGTSAQAADRTDGRFPPPHPQVIEILGLRLNLASAMIKALDSNMVCDAEAYPSAINQEVSIAWFQATEQQKSGFLKKISAKSIIRKDLAFRIAVDFVDLSRDASPEKFARAITGTQFFAFGRGVYGSPYNVTLGQGGVAHQRTMEVLEKEPWVRWHASKTKWSVELNKSDEGERFLIKIGDKLYTLDRSTAGEAHLVPVGVKKDSGEYFEQTLSSSDSYCEA